MMAMLRTWLCCWLPWHRIAWRFRVSLVAERWGCSCGRTYAVNHDVRAVLPWEAVRDFYESQEAPTCPHGAIGRCMRCRP